jgi:hypothetical protein
VKHCVNHCVMQSVLYCLRDRGGRDEDQCLRL